MIQVHLQQIPQSSFLTLSGEANSACLDLEEAGIESVGPLFYDLEVGLSNGGLFATGTLSQKVRMTCVCCLETFEETIMTKEFATQQELQGSEVVDLTWAIREDIQLLLPMHPRCDLGGNKKCSASFPKSDVLRGSHCVTTQAPPPARSVWSALDNILKQ
ncbi:MAG: DUF177 domain-containing protein [Chthoniobacterales bacterium]|nr:DUF177 domain-containing protein [Chthoniobacterales bacterium]